MGLPETDILNNGVAAIYGVSALSKKVKSIKLGGVDKPVKGRMVAETELAGYEKNICVAGAIGAAGLRMGGPLAKRAIDYRGTQGHIDVINQLLIERPGTRIETLTGEGAKDDSAGIPTGEVFSNVAGSLSNIKNLIHYDTDPVDGTNPTSGFNLKDGIKIPAPGGTSIALFARPTDPTKAAFVKLPDQLSIWGFATPKTVPNAKLTMNGNTIEAMVKENVQRVAVAVLKQELKRKPKAAEIKDFIKNKFKVVLMNRKFQNEKILRGLTDAGMEIEYTADDKGKVDFSAWNADGDSLPTKHYGTGNVCLVGDGNVIFPYMKGVHLFIGNSGGPEYLQLLPAVDEINGVFLSKKHRADETIGLDSLITGVVKAAKARSAKGKEEAYKKLFTEKDRKVLVEHGFKPKTALKVFTKKSLIPNSSDYATAMTAITPLSGSKALFDLPEMAGVKIDPKNDLITTDTVFAAESSAPQIVKEEWIMKTRNLKDQITFKKAELAKLDAVKKADLYFKTTQAVLSTYLDLAKMYIYFGLFNYAQKTLNELEQLVTKIEASQIPTEKKRILPGIKMQKLAYKDYMAITEEIFSFTAKDLKKKANKPKLIALRNKVSIMSNPNLTPALSSRLRHDMGNFEKELNKYIKKLK